ncbi:hypothetical protein DTO006G1_9636 [Penicillium roqueforti]|nr:hypothetical protein CBS147337_9774 [Penicillium roqueforti]KAJ5248110.1 hypothetical protein N7524_012070 [Penicillium chrysogenum]KAI2707816.1 hypothetical protein CBS147354_9440 [Penicillium roqueforti]KAI2751590.1 hypothetical protein DTO006G1_9636 [Penicillium roqueforti]KAI3129652.1 hypothetical protein CBS147325_9566 [Penicillium roqueforti]
MSRSFFTDKEVRLATERRLKYIGTAKVNISQIQFDPPLPRDLDLKNLERLCGIFRKNRCRRLDVDNHVPTIVSQHDLTNALRKANVPQQSLLTNVAHQIPQLAFVVGQLRGLHGRHRVQAGAEVLPPADRWWIVDLYLDDIGEELRASLVEEYANQKKPTDGEIYRKIRQYEGEDNEAFRERWFVRLSSNNQERLDQLDNKRNRRLRRAFDRLLAIPGLWPNGMRISVLHRLIASGCGDEIITYLDHIWNFWSSLVASSRPLMKKIDQDTVQALHLLAPGKSRTDAKTARGLVLGGHAFGEFSDEERRSIWTHMKDFDGLIPSLYTLFEDFKYLESCAHCVKRLFGPSTSIWQTMSSMFVPQSDSEEDHSEVGESIIQTSESTFRRQRATDVERLEAGYLQVWLYAMRHYTLMPPDPKKEDDLLAKPSRAKPDQRAIYEMAELARRLGFRSTEIDGLIKSSPDHQIARSALLQARKPDRYRYDCEQFDILVSQIVSCFGHAVPSQPDRSQDLLADSIVKMKVRSGIPQTRTQKQDNNMLFLDCLHAEVEVADTITSFFVRRCVYFAFFGKPTQHGLTLDGDQPMSDEPQSPLFVEEEEPSDSHEQTMHAAPSSVPTPDRQDGLQRDSVRPRGAGQSMEHLQQMRSENERDHLRRRRRRKVQIRGLTSRRATEREQEPMEWNLPSTETRDEDMSDQSSPRDENLSLRETDLEPAPNDSALAPPYDSHDCTGPGDADAVSNCTRISFEADKSEQDPDEGALIVVPDQQDALDDEASANNALQPASPESEADSSPNISGPPGQQALDAYLAHLQRTHEEQERLEEELERERLNEELGLSSQAQPPSGDTPRLEDRQNSPWPASDQEPAVRVQTDMEHTTSATNVANHDLPPVPLREGQPESSVENPDQITPISRDVIRHPSSHTSSADDSGHAVAVSPQPHQGPVEIHFWAFEREQWRQSDRLLVNPSDPSPLERLARKYSWKGYSLYDLRLQSLKPAQCFRAATVDGRNAIFMISEHEERELAAVGRLTKERQLLTMASRALDRIEEETDSITPGRSVKPRPL